MLKLITIAFSIYYTIITESIEISSSCNDKEVDGLYYIKPTHQGEVIPVICNNGYTMIDASLNFDSIASYLTSLYRYGNDDKAMYGTDCADNGGWRDWWTPANDLTKFRVARDCIECQTGGIHGDNTGYYMTNGYFCPVMFDTDGCINPDDSLSENVMCNICDDVEGLCGSGEGRDGQDITDPASYSAWCDCYTLQLSADHQTVTTHREYCQGTCFIHDLCIYTM